MQFRFRLAYQIAKITRCSHKQAFEYCQTQRIKVDGRLETNPGKELGLFEQIELDDTVIRQGKRLRYLLFHKPKGYECTTNRKIKENIYQLLPAHFQDLFTLGRLDLNSEGLLLLTNDGAAYRRMMNLENDLEKEYLVRTLKSIQPSLELAFSKPFPLGDRMTKPAFFEQLDEFSFRVILKEGINRQIRRICAKSQNQVVELVRIRFGTHHLGDLKPGNWKELDGF